MKKLIVLTFIALFASSAFADEYHLIKTCTYPLFEGEYQVYLSKDRQKAYVSYSGVKEYPAQIEALGPVSSFIFKEGRRQLKIIIAVDEGHELHARYREDQKFTKIEDLRCY